MAVEGKQIIIDPGGGVQRCVIGQRSNFKFTKSQVDTEFKFVGAINRSKCIALKQAIIYQNCITILSLDQNHRMSSNTTNTNKSKKTIDKASKIEIQYRYSQTKTITTAILETPYTVIPHIHIYIYQS